MRKVFTYGAFFFAFELYIFSSLFIAIHFNRKSELYKYTISIKSVCIACRSQRYVYAHHFTANFQSYPHSVFFQIPISFFFLVLEPKLKNVFILHLSL